ncbi:MAG: hypothetical protein IJ653_07070 [Bacteroidales bacterium]|nr:hypothetical protein [Bacteroidales bacterium]
MKKTLIYSSLLLAAVALSCTREPIHTPVEEVIPGDPGSISLRVRSAEPVTKAFPDGENAYNENSVLTLDYFIYTVDPSAEGNTSTAATAHGRITYDTAVVPVDASSSAAAGKVVNLKDYPDFAAAGKTGYVYVIANLPDATNSPDNYFEVNADGNLQQVVGTTTTVIGTDYASLQAVEVVASFNKLTDGKFTAQPNFVMKGMNNFTISGDGAVPVTVELSRIASKLSLDMQIIKFIEQFSFDASGISTYKYTWVPNVDQIQVYLNYVNPHGAINGNTRTYEIGSYFSYNRYAYIPDINEGGIYTEKVLARNEDGSLILDDEGNPTYVDGVSYPAFNVTGSPFYSYPTAWDPAEPTAPFIKIILPWVAYKIDNEDYIRPSDDAVKQALIEAAKGFPAELTIDGTTVGARVTTQAEIDKRGGHEFYYKINVPYLNTPALEANHWYKLAINIAVLGSDVDELLVELAGNYHVIAWGTEEDLGGDLSAGRYLDVSSDAFEMYSNTLDIPIKASGDITVTAFGSTTGSPTATYPIATSTSTGSLTYSTTSSEGVYFQVTAEGRNNVKVSHNMVPFSTSFTTANAKDIAKVTYKFRIALDGYEDTYYKDITVTQYPALYVEKQTSTNRAYLLYYYHNNNGSISGITSGNPRNNANYTLGSAGGGDVKSTDLMIISVKSLAGLTSNYPNWVIGDPRVRLGDAMGSNNYYTDRYIINNQWLRTDLGTTPNYFDNYLVADVNQDNTIAPRFMLSSGYNTNTGKGTWKANAERCAGYQEDGYPAGRWRLPTEAEILFCSVLADTQLINNPFGGGSGYWAASGRYANGSSLYSPSTEESRSSRCVYDLWYWGDDAPLSNKSAYTIMLPAE